MNKFEKYWLVQLAAGTKRKVVSYVEDCEMFMSQFKTQVKLNVLPLGSYDVLIGMEWIEKHRVVLNYFKLQKLVNMNQSNHIHDSPTKYQEMEEASVVHPVKDLKGKQQEYFYINGF